MGIDAKTIELMERFGIAGHGAAFGYPDYVEGRKRSRSEAVFARLGVKLDVFDIGYLEDRITHLIDLNKPCPTHLVGKYDFTVNPGTYEQVFNSANAMAVGYLMTKPGGLGFHHGSVGRPRQGYWNSTLNTWPEWCKVNGELLHFESDSRVYYAVTKRGQTNNFQWPQENNVR